MTMSASKVVWVCSFTRSFQLVAVFLLLAWPEVMMALQRLTNTVEHAISHLLLDISRFACDDHCSIVQVLSKTETTTICEIISPSSDNCVGHSTMTVDWVGCLRVTSHLDVNDLCGINCHCHKYVVFGSSFSLYFVWMFIRSYVMPYHIMSYHIMSCHIISYHIISYHIILYYTISYYRIPCYMHKSAHQ